MVQRLSRKIIHQTINDLTQGAGTDYDSAKTYIESQLFETHRKVAGYPEELLECLRELVITSGARRVILSKEVKVLLKKIWDK